MRIILALSLLLCLTCRAADTKTPEEKRRAVALTIAMYREKIAAAQPKVQAGDIGAISYAQSLQRSIDNAFKVAEVTESDVVEAVKIRAATRAAQDEAAKLKDEATAKARGITLAQLNAEREKQRILIERAGNEATRRFQDSMTPKSGTREFDH